MDARPAPAPIYAFGSFELDSGRMTLTRGGVDVVSTPRVLSTLLYLVEHAGELIGREEMLRALWNGRVMEQANLSQAVSAVRKMLGGDGEAWILTVPGKGYRFTGQVEVRAVRSLRNGGPGPCRGPRPAR